MICPNCKNDVNGAYGVCPACGAVLETYGQTPPSGAKQIPYQNQVMPKQEQPMRWYKFVIYVQLFLAAFLNLGNAITYLSGSVYGDSAALIYAMFGWLRSLDIFLGIFSLILAAYAIFVRQMLYYKKKYAPVWYYIMIGINIALNMIYMMVIWSITNILNDSSLIMILATLFYLIPNIIYFQKRKHLFVN